MGALLSRAVGWFVAPPPDRTVLPSAAIGPPIQDDDAAGPSGGSRAIARAPTIALLCAPKDLRLAGGATALAAIHLTRSSCALIAEWTGEEPSDPVDRICSPAARRLAVDLRTEGHAAQATGRVVRLSLPADEADAAEQFGTLDHAHPTILGIAGPRGEPFSAAIAAAGRALLVTRAGTDPGLAMLAVADLTLDGAPVRTLELAPSPAAALLARSGTALTAPLRAPLLAALGDG